MLVYYVFLSGDVIMAQSLISFMSELCQLYHYIMATVTVWSKKNFTAGGGLGQSAGRDWLLPLPQEQEGLRGRHQQCEERAGEHRDRDQHVHGPRPEELHWGTQQTFEVSASLVWGIIKSSFRENKSLSPSSTSQKLAKWFYFYNFFSLFEIFHKYILRKSPSIHKPPKIKFFELVNLIKLIFFLWNY